MPISAAGGLTVRQAGVDDVAELANLIAQSVRSDTIDAVSIKAKKQLSDNVVLIGSLAGRSIGCIMVSIQAISIIHTLCIIPTWRRKGFAKRLVAAIIEHEAVPEHVEAFWTAIDESGPNAEAGFTAVGFERRDDMTVKGMPLMVLERQSRIR